MGQSSSISYANGFHVVKVKPGSPGASAGLVAYFDYLVAANDVILNEQNNAFVQILQNHVDQPVTLVVFNSKTAKTREVTVTPNADWDVNKKELLGVSIRFCNIKSSSEFVWHILEVFPNSPATASGLQPFDDYIVGASAMVFQSSDDFFHLVSSNMGKELEFFVYNSKTDSLRSVILVPNKEWGGPGSLGCNVAYGILHKIPTKEDEEQNGNVVAPEEAGTEIASIGAEQVVTSPSTTIPVAIEPIETPIALPTPEALPTFITSQPVEVLASPTPLQSIKPISSVYLPSSTTASVPNVNASATVTLPPSQSAGNLSAPQNSNLTDLKKQQEQLQAKLALLRAQLPPK